MRSLLHRSTHDLAQDLIYLHAQLHSDSETADLAADVTGYIAELRRQDHHLRELEDAEVLALAHRDRADNRLDRLILDTGRHALATYRTRDAAAYRALFDRAPSDMARSPIDNEVELATQLATKLQQASEPQLAALSQPLLDAANLVRSTQADLTSRRNATAIARSQRDALKEELDISRKRIHGQLSSRFAGDRSRVESFFRPQPSRTRSPREEEGGEA